MEAVIILPLITIIFLCVCVIGHKTRKQSYNESNKVSVIKKSEGKNIYLYISFLGFYIVVILIIFELLKMFLVSLYKKKNKTNI